VGDLCDNCKYVSNENQDDLDSDELGDVCDPDDDGDEACDPGVVNPAVCMGVDNCPDMPNPEQADSNGDGQISVEELDTAMRDRTQRGPFRRGFRDRGAGSGDPPIAGCR